MNWVRLKFAIEFELPKKVSSRDRKNIVRLAKSCRFLNELVERKPEGITADRHHLADCAEVMETLESTVRRALATCREDE